MTNGIVVLDNGNLTQGLTNAFTITSNNKLVSTNGVKLAFTTNGPRAGLFSGSVVVGPEKVSKTIKGAFLDSYILGFGWFLGTNESGGVLIFSTDVQAATGP